MLQKIIRKRNEKMDKRKKKQVENKEIWEKQEEIKEIWEKQEKSVRKKGSGKGKGERTGRGKEKEI